MHTIRIRSSLSHYMKLARKPLLSSGDAWELWPFLLDNLTTRML
jgi:hypothetical protein